MGGKKAKRGDRGKGEGGREGELDTTTQVPPNLPPPPHSLRHLGTWDSPGRSCPLGELTKRTGHQMPTGQYNRLGWSPEVRVEVQCKIQISQGLGLG